MKKVKRLWMPLLLGALLLATLAGAAGARPNARPEASPQLVDHMFSAQHCVPYYNLAAWIFQAPYVACPTAPCGFACPVKPPHEGLIRVQRLAMYAFDNGANDVCISLQHAYPKTGTYVSRIINQCTTNNVADPQVISCNPANFKVSQLQDLYVGAVFSGTTQKLYGFKVKYEPL